MFFDTHVHFSVGNTVTLDTSALERAWESGVRRLIATGGDPRANAHAVELARMHPEQVRAAAGINRDLCGRDWSAEELKKCLEASETVALGEIGLDFHREPTDRTEQINLFEQMLALARDTGQPVVVHSRQAENETLDCLNKHVAAWRGVTDRIGVQHCFTGTADFARKLLNLGFMISFSGILTFKNAQALKEIAAWIPEDQLLIETDSPWLAPEPYRGRPNEPALLRHVAETLATLRNTTVEHIATVTTRNAKRLFAC